MVRSPRPGGMIDRFMEQDDARFDDVLVADMITLAKDTGDNARNRLPMDTMTFEQGNFWTSHFGGVYLFRAVNHPAAAGDDLSNAGARDMRNLARRHQAALPPEWHGLAKLLRWAEDGGPWPRIDSDHPAYFYTLRARRHADADLVNMLLADLTPLDVRQLFICHKDAFYAAYAGWPDGKRAYVAHFLATRYQDDKPATRAALFGHADVPKSRADGISRVGPWGAVKGR